MWNLPNFIMATLINLLADKTTGTSVDFRINDKPSIDKDGKETFWANGWVEGKNGKLLCIGATVDTLQKMQDDPSISSLMLTKPEAKVAEKTGLEYDMCQLAIARVDFSFSLI